MGRGRSQWPSLLEDFEEQEGFSRGSKTHARLYLAAALGIALEAWEDGGARHITNLGFARLLLSAPGEPGPSGLEVMVSSLVTLMHHG